jgi:hypothetical protein
MEIKDKIWLGFCLMFCFAGVLFLIIAWNSWRATYRIVRNGIRTQGIVVDLYHKPVRGLERRTGTLAPVVQFYTASGEQVQYYSQTYTSPPMYQPGQTVDIWYLPENPHQATLDGLDAWILPVVFGFFGLAASLIGFPALLRAIF